MEGTSNNRLFRKGKKVYGALLIRLSLDYKEEGVLKGGQFLVGMSF
jgi:hypothetical protein